MNKQSGVVLITILLVVVIATVMATAMIQHQNLMIHKVRNNLDHGQARQYALGGEELARQILWEDFEDDDKRDHLLEKWAQGVMNFEFEDGNVTLEITDLQSRLNINSLSHGQQAIVRFRSLFAHTGLDGMYLDRLIDWMDPDDSARQSGAEDFHYQGLERPYRTAGRPMVEVSEMRLLLDMDQTSFDSIAPFLSALPAPGVPVNINTVSADVLQSFSPKLDVDTANRLISERDAKLGFDSVTEFLQSPDVAGMGIPASGLGVQSTFFQVRVQAAYKDTHGYLTSVIQRNINDGGMRVIYRNFGQKVFLTQPDETGELKENSVNG